MNLKQLWDYQVWQISRDSQQNPQSSLVFQGVEAAGGGVWGVAYG